MEMGRGCKANVKDRKSTLAMQNIRSKQAFDIFVKSKIERYQSNDTIEDCIDSQQQFSEQKFV